MHDNLENWITRIAERQPLTYKATYPKRITPPNGYFNPKYFAITLWSELQVGFMPELNMLPHVTGLLNALMQLEYRVPTYFVKSEFAQAVAQTEPPADFKFSEIKWPLPAMLFVLPTDFVMNYFGYLCPFLSVTVSPAGMYPDRLKNLPLCPDIQGQTVPATLKMLNTLSNKADRFNVVYPVYGNGKDTLPVDYTGSYTLGMNVNEMATAPFQDATYLETSTYPDSFSAENALKSGSLPAEGEPERIFNVKVQAFAVKLMLALTARPNYITVGTVSRPQKIKKGVVRDELWHPNLIGWDYRAHRATNTAGTGTHASPRLHWRRGHLRNQPFGPKPWTETSTKRLVWIEPILVNAEADEETK